jgi:hypothetical protein
MSMAAWARSCRNVKDESFSYRSKPLQLFGMALSRFSLLMSRGGDVLNQH